MKTIQERKRVLLGALQEITEVKISDTILTVRTNTGNIVKLNTDYDAKKFHFPVGSFIEDGGILRLCIGVDEEDCLWVLREESEGATFFRHDPAGWFKEEGYKLVE